MRSAARAESEARARLCARLRGRREEIEEAALTRVNAIAESDPILDPSYVDGLRASVAAAIEYALEAIESGEGSPPIPVALLAQARLAARNGVPLDTVLRRYFAGYSLFGYFLLEEARGGDPVVGVELQRLLISQAGLFDRLLAAVSEEYGLEARGRSDSHERRQAQNVARLLAGELVDASELSYDLDAVHVGLVAKGLRAGDALYELGASLDRRLLLVNVDSTTSWAWLGGRVEPTAEQLGRLADPSLLPEGALAIGEPCAGLSGWRLTHRQAAAALPIAVRDNRRMVRYRDVALLAAALQDDLLSSFLNQTYLAPLELERDGGQIARETLRAYLATDQNVTSTAAALQVSRNTIAGRLRSIEQRLGRRLSAVSAGLETALQLQALGQFRGPHEQDGQHSSRP